MQPALTAPSPTFPFTDTVAALAAGAWALTRRDA
jgi:hypothetical protein